MNSDISLNTPTLPRLNEPAPDFRVKTTHGLKTLADYKGRWLVLFSHPADFTPVCTTEFMAFAKAHEHFQALGADLLGLSIDSNYAHIAWARTIDDISPVRRAVLLYFSRQKSFNLRFTIPRKCVKF
jgi:peroxiredoxin (alkyl hydroperoxide reductase subunit C)